MNSRVVLLAVGVLVLALGIGFMVYEQDNSAPVTTIPAGPESQTSPVNPAEATVKDMALGNPMAQVQVVEYASFTCPHCASFHNNAFKPLKVGQATEGVIKTIRDDGKVDVALQRVDKGGRDALQQAILDDLEAHGGISTLTDKSAPEAIYSHFNVSKAAYKKALGALYKQKKITLSPDAVRLNK